MVDLDFISPNEIWAIENDGKVFRYNGSGWIFIQNLAIGYPSAFRAISVVSANDVWVSCSVNNYGLWHYDGIKFIKDYKLLTGQSYTGRYTVEMLNSTEGWSSSTSYTFAYFDGNEWQAVTSPISSAVYCIKMLNSKSGWAVGSGGQILRYNE